GDESGSACRSTCVLDDDSGIPTFGLRRRPERMSMSLRIVGAGCMLAGVGCTEPTPTSELTAYIEASMTESLLHVEILLRDLRDRSPYAIEPDEHVLVEFRGQVLDLLFFGSSDPYDPNYIAR